MSEHQQLIDELRAVGHELDAVNPTADPVKARRLLRRRKALRHAAEAARDRAIAYQARQRKGELP
jgi:hypothetical protein